MTFSKTANGRMDLDLPAFRVIEEPFIAELYRQRKHKRPEPSEFTGALYDALSAAGMEVTIVGLRRRILRDGERNSTFFHRRTEKLE